MGAEEYFGLTNSEERIQKVREFFAAAVADGWEAVPSYGGSEPVEVAASLTRDGFKLSTLARVNQPPFDKFKYQASIHGWGPDGMAVRVPLEYSMDVLRKALRICMLCDAEDVQTFRYSFAGRCCEKCIPKARAEYEKPGWTK